MTKVSDLYRSEASELRRQLASVQSPPQAAAVIRRALERYGDLTGPYMSQLTVPQARLASALLASLSSAADSLATVNSPAATGGLAQGQSEPARRTLPNGGAVGGMLGGAAGAAALSMIGPPVGLVLGVVAGGIIGAGLGQFKGREPANEPCAAAPKGMVGVDVEALLTLLEHGLKQVDDTVALVYGQAGEPPARNRSRLTEHTDLLELLQALLGDLADPTIATLPVVRLRLQNITSLLRRHGITVAHFDPAGGAQANGSAFAIEASIDPELSEPIPMLPALFKDDDLLLRGRVVHPAPSAT